MEERVKKEIEYYDARPDGANVAQGMDFEGFRPLDLASFRRAHKLLKDDCPGKLILDWGCGNGVHAIPIAKAGAKKVVGIDLSCNLLAVARQLARDLEIDNKIEFLEADCERTGFKDNEFGVIFNGGTFSSVDIKIALPELARILKPDGVLIGVETFGHNPLANFNRALNVRSGKRTAWAAAHIFNNDGVELARRYFKKIEIEYFHLFSWVLFPLLKKNWGKRILDLTEPFDAAILKLPFLKTYAFKVVFKFSNPIK
jgi:ubiquinone/menaquinone biosynthesis C-methylase UbiE